ncbi:lipid II flippase MurJ, partial [Streptomyces scabiei]
MIYQIVKTLIAALLTVTIPRLAMLFGKNKMAEYKSLLSKLTNILVLLALPASVGLIMLSKEVVLLISGKEYLRATNSLSILSLAYIFSILAWILTDCVLIPSKREKYVLRS